MVGPRPRWRGADAEKRYVPSGNRTPLSAVRLRFERDPDQRIAQSLGRLDRHSRGRDAHAALVLDGAGHKVAFLQDQLDGRLGRNVDSHPESKALVRCTRVERPAAARDFVETERSVRDPARISSKRNRTPARDRGPVDKA